QGERRRQAAAAPGRRRSGRGRAHPDRGPGARSRARRRARPGLACARRRRAGCREIDAAALGPRRDLAGATGTARTRRGGGAAGLQFEGDRYHAHRVLRAAKNRFGSTNELGVFEMTGAGLVGVPEPSELFGRGAEGEVGAAVACALEGTRPILLEIQALVAPTDLAMPRRVATGVDPKRLAMIVAVLSRHARVALGAADVFVNVAGGVRIDEPGADLAVALAIASAARGVAVEEGTAAFGEIGLTGRL